MEDFVHLHVHTYYSLLDGQSSIQKLVDKAVADGMRGMAITDHGNMFGVKELFNYCRELNAARKKKGLEPFKPIFGCEVYVARRDKEQREKEKGDIGGHHLILLAKNYQGYKNLIKIVSRAWVDGFYGKPRTDHKDLETYHEGLICCSACIAGEVPAYIIEGNIEKARLTVEWYRQLFGDDYYLELQRHEVKNPSQRANRETFPLQQKANRVLIEFAHEYGIKLVCTNDCHFVDEDNAEAHDHLLCLATGKDLDDPSRLLYSKQEWFKTRQEMQEVFADVPEAMAGTIDVLDKVELYDINHAPIMPFFPIPESFGTEEQWREKISKDELIREFTTDENGKNPLAPEEAQKKIERMGGIDKLYRIKFEADYLANLAYGGARKLYGDPLNGEVAERIKFELHVMKTMGFPGYFLIVQDFINSARDELGVMVGPGRGSAAGSVVAYCLGITKIDPLKYDLLFERFLNPDRISLPDIDTDFDDDGRARVLEWVEDKYGHEKVAHIITYATMATKNSIKDVARVEKVPLAESNRLCKAIPDRLPNEMKMTLDNAIQCVPELQEAEQSADPRMRNTIKYARMLEGTVRGTGIHACGTIICRDDISDWVPVSTADDKDHPGHRLLATQYDGHVIEETGLIKMDFLGLKTLSIMKEALENIRLTKGIELDLDNIPIDDPLTFKLYQEGRTIGTFQFESAGMQKYLKELKPTVFEDLIAMNALYRPGPMKYIPDFIARKHGLMPIVYDIPCMEKYLKDTYGITVYQEQVMLLSRQLANFTRGESDTLRKAMGKKKKDILEGMQNKFIVQGQANGYDHDVLAKIWNDWTDFASYAFNKSHATCYSWVAYQTAYLKAHYPAEYMAGNMSRNVGNITEITKLMSECLSMGIATLGPDANESRLKFSVNKRGEIRFGLAAVKGFGESAAMAVVKERDENGPFADIFDFMERVDLKAVNRKAIEALVLSGGFDSFGLPREVYFEPNAKGVPFVEQLVRFGQTYQSEKKQSENSLFGDTFDMAISRPPIPKAQPWSSLEKLGKERALVGIYLSAHPLDDYYVVLRAMCNTHCSQISRETDLKALSKLDTITFGGIVTEVKERFSNKTNKPFGIVTIEDFDGKGELTLFGENWLNWKSRLDMGYCVYIKAKCAPRFRWNPDSLDLVVEEIEMLSDVKSRGIDSITVDFDALDLTPGQASALADAILRNPGKTSLLFNVRDRASGTTIPMKSSKMVNPTKDFVEFLLSCSKEGGMDRAGEAWNGDESDTDMLMDDDAITSDSAATEASAADDGNKYADVERVFRLSVN